MRIGPRVITTGEPLDGTRVYYPGGVALDGGALIDGQISRAQALGFDFIKTYVRLPDLLQKRVIDAAHQAGMPVTSHEIYPAVAYGADGVEHIRGTSRRGYSPKNSETASLVSRRDRPAGGVRDDADAHHRHSGRASGADAAGRRLAGRPPHRSGCFRRRRPPRHERCAHSRLPTADLAGREALVVRQERLVGALVKAGGRVIAGTDSPINPYGLSLLLELEHYVRGGLSPAEAIRTATAVPAEAMGLGADLGTIEAGKLADLIVVDGNPLTNITDLRRTRRVVKDGVVHEIAALLDGPMRP